MADDALSSKTVVEYDGNSVDVTNIDGQNDLAKDKKLQKEAIHQALN